VLLSLRLIPHAGNFPFLRKLKNTASCPANCSKMRKADWRRRSCVCPSPIVSFRRDSQTGYIRENLELVRCQIELRQHGLKSLGQAVRNGQATTVARIDRWRPKRRAEQPQNPCSMFPKGQRMWPKRDSYIHGVVDKPPNSILGFLLVLPDLGPRVAVLSPVFLQLSYSSLWARYKKISLKVFMRRNVVGMIFQSNQKPIIVTLEMVFAEGVRTGAGCRD
jgi:hypothetical protein